MSPKDQQLQNPFPPEYAHLHDWVTETEARLGELDQELNRPVQAPRLAFTPPGYSTLPPPTMPMGRSRPDIQQEKDVLKAQVYQRVEKETEVAPAAQKQAARDMAFGRLYKEDLARQAAAERQSSPPAAQWNMNDAQLKVMGQMKDFRDRQRTATPPQPPTQPSHPQPSFQQPSAQPPPPRQTISRPEWSATDRPDVAGPAMSQPEPPTAERQAEAPAPPEPEIPAPEPEAAAPDLGSAVEPAEPESPEWEPEP